MIGLNTLTRLPGEGLEMVLRTLRLTELSLRKERLIAAATGLAYQLNYLLFFNYMDMA